MAYNKLLATHVSADTNFAATQEYGIIDRRKKLWKTSRKLPKTVFWRFGMCL